jgi:hypothetical protein
MAVFVVIITTKTTAIIRLKGIIMRLRNLGMEANILMGFGSGRNEAKGYKMRSELLIAFVGPAAANR